MVVVVSKAKELLYIAYVRANKPVGYRWGLLGIRLKFSVSYDVAKVFNLGHAKIQFLAYDKKLSDSFQRIDDP